MDVLQKLLKETGIFYYYISTLILHKLHESKQLPHFKEVVALKFPSFLKDVAACRRSQTRGNVKTCLHKSIQSLFFSHSRLHGFSSRWNELRFTVFRWLLNILQTKRPTKQSSAGVYRHQTNKNTYMKRLSTDNKKMFHFTFYTSFSSNSYTPSTRLWGGTSERHRPLEGMFSAWEEVWAFVRSGWTG